MRANAGKPPFQGDADPGQHVNFALRICKILGTSHREHGVNLQLLITTERDGHPLNAQVFLASETPVTMHREVVECIEFWKPYIIQQAQPIFSSHAKLALTSGPLLGSLPNPAPHFQSLATTVPARPITPPNLPGRAGYWWLLVVAFGAGNLLVSRLRRVKPRIFKALIETGDVDDLDVTGETAIQFATGYSNTEFGELLARTITLSSTDGSRRH